MAISGSAFDFPILKRVFLYAIPYKKIFSITILLTVLVAFISPVRPWLIQYTFDHYIAVPNEQGLFNMIMLMVGLLITEALMQFYYTYLTNQLGQHVIKDLRMNLFDHINKSRLKFFDHTPIGT